MELSNEKLALLVDHYNDTMVGITRAYKRRDRTAIVLLFVALLMIFQMTWPDTTKLAISTYLGLPSATSIETSFLSSLIWFLLLAATLIYFQVSTYLNRLYRYIASVEESISQYFPAPAFTREGKFYDSKYPPLSKWAEAIYSWVFPILIVLLVVGKLTKDWQLGGFSATNLVNGLIALAVVVTTVLYKLPARSA